jgi:hypothetical protein
MNRIFNLHNLRAIPTSRTFAAPSEPLSRTMSSSDKSNASQPSESLNSRPEEQSSERAQQHAPLPLPGPSDKDGDATKIDMSKGGNTVKLDHLGPLVVNRDGTLSRISNWTEMSEIERQNTLRVLGKRNQLRREALQSQEVGEAEK